MEKDESVYIAICVEGAMLPEGYHDLESLKQLIKEIENMRNGCSLASLPVGGRA